MGLESRSGQGFSRGAVATAITASGIVTTFFEIDTVNLVVATVITVTGIQCKNRRNDFPLRRCHYVFLFRRLFEMTWP